MRTAFSLLFVVLFLAVMTPVAVAINFWMDADAVIARATPTGALLPSGETRRLSTAESIIAADQFAETWGGRGYPCRTLALLWTDLTNPDAHPPAMPVSQRAATMILADHRGTSVRWQVRRILIGCQLEQRFNDAQLLRIWLAAANFGQNTVGLDNAARANFAKRATALNVEESAKLAALLHAPGLRYQPDRWAREAQTIRARVIARPH